MSHHDGSGAIVHRTVPAGYTYLGQFVDHDMVLDPAELDLNSTTIHELRSMRSPTLDLDSRSGHGPMKQPEYFQDDRVSLLEGETEDVTPGRNASANSGRGFDLPRWGDSKGGKRKTIREVRIPDIRNDENLAVGQLHAAFIPLHNKVARQQKGKVPDPQLSIMRERS